MIWARFSQNPIWARNRLSSATVSRPDHRSRYRAGSGRADGRQQAHDVAGRVRSRRRTAGQDGARATAPGCSTARATRAGRGRRRRSPRSRLVAAERRQPLGHRPRLAARRDTRLKRIIVSSPLPPMRSTRPDPRRHLAERALAAVDELTEDVVDGVEVGADVGDATPVDASSDAATPRSRLMWAFMPSSRCCRMIGRQRPAAAKAARHDSGRRAAGAPGVEGGEVVAGEAGARSAPSAPGRRSGPRRRAGGRWWSPRRTSPRSSRRDRPRRRTGRRSPSAPRWSVHTCWALRSCRPPERKRRA